MSKRKGKPMLTTIKVEKEVGAMVSVVVKKLKVQGESDMTASLLLRRLIQQNYPDVANLIDPDIDEQESEA